MSNSVRARLIQAVEPLAQPPAPTAGNRFIVCGPATAQAYQDALLHARSHKPLLLIGATGTGKTSLADVVHVASGRNGPFVAHTVGEADPNLERSELFGHERGAFTGATQRRVGWLEEAADGTLLLDDVHHMRLETQTMLLRAFDREAFRRIGGARDLPLRCRVILGLGQSPDELVRHGKLLPELRYRFGFREIRIPALNERRDEIVPLAQHFLRFAPAATGVPAGPTGFAPGVLAMLEQASYEGNVRELRDIVEVAYERANGESAIREDHLPGHVRVALIYRRRGSPDENRSVVRWALWRSRGVVGKAAALLGVHRNTVSKVKALLAIRGELN